MREGRKDWVEKLGEKRRRHRRTFIILVLCSIMVASTVMWQMILPGIAWAEAYQPDPEADLETEEQWVQEWKDIAFTDTWGENVAALAKTQAGYCESEKNFVVENQEKKGYTRYGDWSGDTYGNWDAAFAAFCLHYAQVPEDVFPIESDSEEWMKSLQKAALYGEATVTVPETGDLVILQKKEQETEKQVGIVTAVEKKDGTIYIQTLEGNCSNQVKANEYQARSTEILGYGLLNHAQEIVRESAVMNSSTTETVNERLAVELTAGRNGGSAGAGETLYAKVISRYSKANNPNQNVGIAIRVGDLPEGVTLAGFANGTKEVVWKDEQNQEHTIVLKCVEEDGASYIKFEQPAGATVEFEVQFNSTNGIMADGSSVTLEIEKEKITGLDTPIGGNDLLGDPLILSWNAKNEWDPVDKKVNNAEHNEIAVTGQNRLSGELTYTIQANSSNNENFGEIWTDYIMVTDTFILPANISFPAGASVNSSGTAITDSSGKEIFYISKMPQGGAVTELTFHGKEVVYTIRIPNSHKKDGVPVKEQDNLSLEMKLNARLLELAEGYSGKSAEQMKEDIIKNNVEIQPVPYKPYEVKKTADSATTVPVAVPEDFVVEKKADKKSVQAGDTVTYTLSVKNTGDNAIKVKDSNGAFYQVTDRLPVYLYLTERQIRMLPGDMTYEKGSNTIHWIPGRTDIAPKETRQVSFAVTVKEATNEAMANLPNNATIKNVAQYKSESSNQVNITYKKAELKIEKTGKDEDGDGMASNGERITYTIKISNHTDLNAALSELITDTLPKGLIFESAGIGDKKDIKTTGTYTLHGENSSGEGEHKVTFIVSGQRLTWDIGIVHAHETVILTYVCKVNVDQLESKTQIWNSVSGASGGSDSNQIPVKYPIELDKSVEQDTSATYPDKTIFDYTLTIRNDREHPSEKDDLELVDWLPVGMTPVDCPLIQHQNNGNTVVDKKVTWEDFLSGNLEQIGNSSFTSMIGGREAKVKKDWGIELTWEIGKLNPGEEVKITYRAQINLTEEQKKEGGRFAFTNMAYIDGISDLVTVYGGTAVGQLYLEKRFDGQILWNNSALTEEQKKITFELTGTGADGKLITFSDGTQKQIVTLADFNNGSSGTWSHVFRNLPVGTYTVVEKNAEVEGKILTTIYQVDAGHKTEGASNQAIIKEQEQTNVIVNNSYGTGASVDLQKSVWAIEKESVREWNNVVWTGMPDKKLFAVDPEDMSSENLVIYNMTVINTGSETIHLDSLEDELPKELNYLGICRNRWNLNRAAFTQEITTDNWGGLNLYDGQKLVSGVKVTAVSDEKSSGVTFTFNQDSKGYDLESGKAVTFLILCEVNDQVRAGKPITNTVKLAVDECVDYKDYEEIKTVNTPYDQNQNNGGSKDLGVENGKRTISSTVTIIPDNTIVPGIAKKAVSYIVPGKTQENPLSEDSNIQPNSTVKWEVTLYNDGVMDLTDYRVEDAVTPSFHLMNRTEAREKDISSPYKLEIFSYDGQLRDSIDVSEQVWNICVEGLPVSSHVFAFNGKKYTIPAGGYAKFTLYTNNTVENYKVYKNTAVLIPDDSFNANEVKHGELKKDNDGRYIGVTASGEVNALGDYASVSWKTITEKGNEANTARGTQDKNYISVGLASEYVTYTNNVRNISGKEFSRFTVIDLMPGNNDTGVINQEDIRGSEFNISFAENLNIYVLANGVETPVKEYRAEFSSKTSFTQEDFDDAPGKEWHETWQAGDRSFRIGLPEDFVLEPYQTLVVQYDGRLGADAKPGAVAWNSFGYQYYSGDHSTPMKAEPPKVGVMIPKVPIVQKEVVDSSGKVQEYDAGKVFTFVLEEKGSSGNRILCEFTVCQGGYIALSGLKDENGNNVILENGKEYIITESAEMPEGYELIGIGEKGGTLGKDITFTYYDNKDITIFARNRVDTYQYELPKTGGTGTIVYTAGGVLLMLTSLLYGYRLRRKSQERIRENHL